MSDIAIQVDKLSKRYRIGRSQDGQWWVVETPNLPEGQAWVSAAFVEVENADNVPVVPKSASNCSWINWRASAAEQGHVDEYCTASLTSSTISPSTMLPLMETG